MKAIKRSAMVMVCLISLGLQVPLSGCGNEKARLRADLNQAKKDLDETRQDNERLRKQVEILANMVKELQQLTELNRQPRKDKE